MIPLTAMQARVCEMHQRIQTDFSLPILDTEHHGGTMAGSPYQIHITASSQPHCGDGISAHAKRRASQLLRDDLDWAENGIATISQTLREWVKELEAKRQEPIDKGIRPQMCKH